MEIVKPSLTKQKGDNLMIQQNGLLEQGGNSFLRIFTTLKVGQLLRQAGIRKSYGYSCLAVFTMLFQLAFQSRNLYRILTSKRAEIMPRKDVFYRFLNEPRFNWRRFYQLLSTSVVSQFE